MGWVSLACRGKGEKIGKEFGALVAVVDFIRIRITM